LSSLRGVRQLLVFAEALRQRRPVGVEFDDAVPDGLAEAAQTAA
jgi:hypothetical protein